jgi:hypothetical protein
MAAQKLAYEAQNFPVTLYVHYRHYTNTPATSFMNENQVMSSIGKPLAHFVRQTLTYQEFLANMVRPQVDRVLYVVDREPTAEASFHKFYRAVAQMPDAVIRMGGVGMKIDGRRSLFDLWNLPGNLNQYAVDARDDGFVAKTCPMPAGSSPPQGTQQGELT